MPNVVGVFRDTHAAEQAITQLRENGVADKNISFAFINKEGKTETQTATGEHVASGAASGIGTGAIIGAIAGLAVANGILPGLGTIFVGGALATSLGLTGAAATTAAGAITGAAAGGVIGAFTGLGMKDEDARRYEERVKNGDVVVIAHTDDPDAKTVMEQHGAEDVNEYETTTA